MNYYPISEKKSWKVCFAAFLLILLKLTRSGLGALNLGFIGVQMLMYGVIVAAGVVFLVVNRRNLKEVIQDPRIAAALVFTFVMLMPMILKQDFQMMYGTLLAGFYLAVFLSYFTTVKEVAGYYVRIMCVLAVYSLIATYILRRLPDAGLLAVPQMINTKGNGYYNFGLCYVSITHVSYRNFGMFREPGVYQFFLMVALYLNNYWVEWKKERDMWIANGILAVTMLSTVATGGIIELALFVVVLFFDKKMYRDKRVRMLAIVLVLAVVAVITYSWIQRNRLYRLIYVNLIGKFVNREDSFVERADAIFSNIRLILANPILGAKFKTVLHGVNNNTSSTLIVFAACGLLAGLVHTASWFALVWKKESRVWANLALLLILFMSFNTQNLTWDLYFWLFPIMALVERGLPLIRSYRSGGQV